MNAIEFHDVTVRFPRQRVWTLKEWAIRGMKGNLSMAKFEALRGVSLTVKAGEAVGIIGGNGSGKSTTLRVAAGIVPPAEGQVVVRGSVAPVIELGTGFDLDLTGRENIYFNGALLGRTGKDMARAGDEIIDFAALGEFIDAPLRTYSTGMVARLAFSIATLVDADVILLDEIISTGDEWFRERCNERIQSFYRKGSTVVLVSHDLKHVERLCHRVVWLQKGVVRASGEAGEVIAAYREFAHR